MDLEQQELSFTTKEGRVTLHGDPNLHNQMGQLQKVFVMGQWSHEAQLLNVDMNNTISIPTRIQEVLEKFAQVFREPTALPPRRGFEHSIRLWEGSGTVSVRPYRYPHAHMEAIEKMVKEMLASGIIRKCRSPFASPVLLVKKRLENGGFALITAH